MTIMLGKYAEFNPGFDMPSIKEDFAEAPYKGQKVIAEYLKKGELVLAKAGKMKMYSHMREYQTKLDFVPMANILGMQICIIMWKNTT